MPKMPRKQEEVEFVKDQILDTALEIIVEQGFTKLSMRKIAARLGISATTIYNYYKSKDELYFMIRIHGFEMLSQSFEEAYDENDTPDGRSRAMIERYIRFGMDFPDYYDVMFTNRNVPKYRESIGTSLESVAARDSEMGLTTLSMVARVVAELHASDPLFSGDDARYLAIRLWCDVNGIITLSNSRLLHEVEEDTDGLIRRLADDVFTRYRE